MKSKKTGISVPSSVQDSIPYSAVYGNGIIETTDGRFTKSYLLGDCNFSVACDEEQYSTYSQYEKFLNMFAPGTNFEISLFNRRTDRQKIIDDIMIKHKRDGLDEYRDELNSIIRGKMSEGKNDLVKEKYLTVSIEAGGIDEAVNVFSRLDAEIEAAFSKLCDKKVTPMNIEERLKVFYDIYNPDSPISLGTKITSGDTEIAAFDLASLARRGLTTKDLIGPSSIKVDSGYMMLGDKYVRVLFVDSYPSVLSTAFLSDVTDTNFTLLTSVTYEPIPQDKMMKKLSRQLTTINANIIDTQKKASRSGYSANIISPSLLNSKEETSRLMEEIRSKNQKVFYTTVTIVVYADSLEELNSRTSRIVTTAAKYVVGIKRLSLQQEAGFNQALPLAGSALSVQRILTTETAALFIPFTSMELSQKNGMYYGLNAITKNLIMYNRTKSDNANGLIFGTPGSGKSLAAKREMLSVLLSTDDDVYVIDPEREYVPMAELLGGEVIRIAAGGTTRINPFDMDMRYADEDNPISLKADYIITLCETIVGHNTYGLTPSQRSIIDRCVKEIYQPYIEHMRAHKNQADGLSLDRDQMPTFADFYNALLRQPDAEARNLALAIELYAVGSLNTFSGKTNVDIKRRFVVYDIKDIRAGMKELGLQVCLNDVWNRTISNKAKKKHTWFYIDEFYLLTQTESSAKFLQEIFKRARKWGGCPTGITQNVQDMLSSKESRTIISNCEFIMMLNQSAIDGADLADMLNISESQMEFVTNAEPGQGLIYNGKAIVPFTDKYPENTKTFKVMTTKFEA